MLPPAIGTQRRAFLSWLEKQDGKTSLWGAKGKELFDCSGLVTCGYEAAGNTKFIPALTNTDKLWNGLPYVELPVPGDLVLYGIGKADDVSHVMVWWGDGTVFGACGATSKITSAEESAEKGHRVRLQKLRYRNDFRGFRRSPLDMVDLLNKQKAIL